jgi:hypothetical protein
MVRSLLFLFVLLPCLGVPKIDVLNLNLCHWFSVLWNNIFIINYTNSHMPVLYVYTHFYSFLFIFLILMPEISCIRLYLNCFFHHSLP